ncbi:YaaW family protein [Cyanothece sp. BG0011]|uniref:YaaW family protein n=1 Tax=Cyanothece sp. BG0011 TaxID=2082950 RepID=UPI000D1FC6E8|nr:YaaW family protein [Cyanothece sp. BG0011]
MDELRSALEMATEEELRQLTQVLFCRKFNPLDYLQTPDPIEIESQDWDQWLDKIEARFRFLASDGLTVLKRKTKRFSYRQTLIRVCHYLKIPYSNEMSTIDIEADIFLNLLGKAWKNLPPAQQNRLMTQIQASLAKSNIPDALPVQLQHNPMNLVLKGSSVVAVNSIVKPLLLKHIAQQFALHFARYQVAQQGMIRGGAAVANQLAVNTARRGMALTAARYGAVRGVLSFVGPVLWGWFLADLGWRAIATNYGRIIPVIFALAQIRLTRTETWELA